MGLDKAATVGQVRTALLGATAAASICVGGRRLPEDNKVKLESLDISVGAEEEVFVCPNYTYGEELLCCPEAVLLRKPAPKLGLEKYLTLWILLAVATGMALGQIPNIDGVLHKLKVGKTNLLTAVGMILMLLPPCASVRYNEFARSISKVPKRIAFGSIVMNWVVGPFLMGGLGMLTLSSQHDLLEGVIFIGAARCIAMVLVWTALAEGDSFLCVSLVLLNSVITVFAYAPMVTLLAKVFGIHSGVTFMTVLSNVAIYLGIPLVIGVGMWFIGCTFFEDYYWSTFLPRFKPVGLLSLLWTCLIMFMEMSKPLTNGQVAILDVFLVMIPLVLYFTIMFFGSWVIGRMCLGITYGQTVTFAFTAASNNFELALAACTAIFGTSSRQAAAAVIGPLLEIPIMLLLVKIALGMRYTEAARPRGPEAHGEDSAGQEAPSSDV
jgi:ACR3 family arsenite transporter